VAKGPAVTTILIPIGCGNETHQMELTRDGDLVPLEHNLEMMQAFTSFGAHKPGCYSAWEQYQESPLLLVWNVIYFMQGIQVPLSPFHRRARTDEALAYRLLARLARDFVTKPIARARKSHQAIPRKALDVAIGYASKTASKEEFDEARKAIKRSLGGHRTFAGSEMVAAVDDALRATRLVVEGGLSTHAGEHAQRRAADAMGVYLAPSIRDNFRPRGRAQELALKEDPAFKRARAKHVAEQRRHFARAMYSLVEETPWPSF
jgi:hypothetical protein